MENVMMPSETEIENEIRAELGVIENGDEDVDSLDDPGDSDGTEDDEEGC